MPYIFVRRNCFYFFFSNIPQNSSDTQIAIIFVINSFYMAYENRSRDNKRESSAFMEKSWALNNFAFFSNVIVVCQGSSSFTFCNESATKIRHVKACPTDTKSWNIAAKNMNCEAIKQNCSSSQQHQFQYHCVINELENALLEVCALNRTIIGE